VKGIAMELWRFLLFSSLEYVGMIVLMFAVFRFSFRGFIPHTVFICLFLSFISHYFREIDLGRYATLAQEILFVVCIYLLYRVPVFYAIIMGTVGYQAYVTLQILLFLFLNKLGFITGEELNYDNENGIFNLFINLAVIACLAFLFHRKGWGFTFIPTGNFGRIKMTGLNISILLLSMINVCNILLLHYYYSENRLHVFFLLSFVQLALLLGLIYYSIRKERQDLD
jgi:hypothetical protein